jgi:hypothetical protein
VQLEPVDLSVKAPVVLQVPRYSPQLPTNGLTYPGKVFPWNCDGFQVGLEVNPEKTKYMSVSRCQKAGQRQSIKIGNRSFESLAKFKYLGTTLTDQNCIHEDIKSRLNSGNACYHSVQSLLSSRLLSRDVKVKI